MAMTYAEISRLSRKDLIERYDQQAQHPIVGLDFLKQEIWRRDSDQLSRNMTCLTRKIYGLTIVVTIFTAINVVAVLAGIWGN